MQQFKWVGLITACLCEGRGLCLETSRFQTFWEIPFPDTNANMYVNNFMIFFAMHCNIIV
jgi:hypothetical protein